MKRFNPDENKKIFKNVTVAIPNISEDVTKEIDKLVRTGDKIKAIGLYREHTGQGLADAKNAIDNYCSSIANPQVKSNQVFSMTVSDSFSITGRGIVVAGNIVSGSIEVGETVNINEETYKISGINMSKKLVDKAEAGMTVGLLLSGLTEKIPSGTMITK